ncbi:MAG TPA: hypothetical protein VKA15_02870 [Isosphaeraceae bacterium]|nr:hypothetical protein [Isosphaeraceae bacterium]
MGEARSNCEHIAGVPLRPETAERFSQIYLAKGVHATTSIEGNTLTEEQVRLQMDKALKLPASQEYLKQEVQNILDACDKITSELSGMPTVDITLRCEKPTPPLHAPNSGVDPSQRCSANWIRALNSRRVVRAAGDEGRSFNSARVEPAPGSGGVTHRAARQEIHCIG